MNFAVKTIPDEFITYTNMRLIIWGLNDAGDFHYITYIKY